MKSYPHTAAVALWYQGKILIAKRKHTKTFPGFWACPGGKVKPLERPTAGILRELYEETGLPLSVTDITLVDGFTADPTTRICFLFEGHLCKEEVSLVYNVEQHKNHDWEWLTPKQALKKKLVPGLRGYLKSQKPKYQ